MNKQIMFSAAVASALLAGNAVYAQPATTPATSPTTQPDAQSQDEMPRGEQPMDGQAMGEQPMDGQAQGDQRPMEEVVADLQQTSTELGTVIGGPDRIFDAEARATDAEQVLPLARKMKKLMVEAQNYPVMAAQVDPSQMDAILVLYGDKDIRGELEKKAAGEGEEALGASTTLIEVGYLQAEDEAGRVAQVEKLNKLAEEHPDSQKVAMTYAGLAGLPMTGEAEKAKINEGIDKLEGETAKMLKDQMSMMENQQNADSKLASLENKPLVIKGKTVNGDMLTTADMKGKVVLVDFWATWCGPCLAELPRVKEIYKQYHDQGFEIVGVSCDESAGDLTNFLKDNPEMKWPQLFDADNPGWHALAQQYGVQGIPTMFLIDKNGVCRTVEARANMEDMIPQLLAEEATANATE